jgi:hypothetical protein
MGMISMEGQAGPAGARGARSTWADAIQRYWSGTFADEQQQAVFNTASASALYLTTTASFLASLVFLSVNYDRYLASSLTFFLIGLGGLRYAQAVARHQNVHPIRKVPSWPGTAAASALFGILMFTVTRAMDPGMDWRSRAVLCAVVAVVWGVVTRLILKAKYEPIPPGKMESPAG